MIKYNKLSPLKISILLLFIITVLALIIRIQYNYNTQIYKPIRADARQYVLYGYNLAYNGTFSQSVPTSEVKLPDSLRSPGYPLLTAASFLIGGNKGFLRVIIWAQIFLSTLLVPVTFFIGIRFLRLWGALIASFLVALSPHLVSMTSYVLTETLFSFLLVSSTISLYYSLKHTNLVLIIVSGLLFGASYLTNETALFIPYIFIIIMLVIKKYRVAMIEQRLFTKVIIFLLIFSIFPAGWMIRNINLPPNAPKGASRAIATMSHGAYPDFIYKDPRFKYFPYREDPMQPAFSSSLDNFRKIFWTRFKERPGRYLRWYLLEKPYYLWSWNILQGQGDVYVYPVITSLYQTSKIANTTREIMKFLHPLILILAVAGIPFFYITYWRGKNTVNIPDTPIILFIICIYFTLLYAIFAPWPRYSVPLRPILYLVALWSLQTGGKFISEKWKTAKHP